jgi:hypothetical protein
MGAHVDSNDMRRRKSQSCSESCSANPDSDTQHASHKQKRYFKRLRQESGEALALVHTAMATKKMAILENILKMVGGGVICDSAMERKCGQQVIMCKDVTVVRDCGCTCLNVLIT